MIPKIRLVDVSGRGVVSERYTLTQREGLKLFQLAVWDENAPPFEEGAPDDQELDHLFDQQWIEFWAESEETAYNELCANLRAFHAAGLHCHDSKEEPFQCSKCVAWFDHYGVLDCLIIPQGSTTLEIINIVSEFESHCVYVLRKMCELVDKVITECGSDYYYSIVDSH
ncbi:hypothetical protein pEaSNUABM55_00202 [Erwinia phage pEa_SNUABM_55]|nr:hypothetical protein pEaSNUABM55_00202 [Erwinia phage pEa_SNUABM_55]